jgi:N-acyl-D-amino-acid deacylase
VIRIAREAKTPAEIWHLKAAGKRNWGRMPEIVTHIEQARQDGLDITADTYAYPAWFNTFSAFIPPWAHDGGDAKLIERLQDPAMRARIRKEMDAPNPQWENEWQEISGPESILVSVVQNPKLVPLQGKTIAEIAKLWNKDAIDTIFDLLIEDHAFTSVAVFGMSEPDVALALAQPWVSICNDSQGTAPDGLLGREHPHPRAYGTFPRILAKYVRAEHTLRLEEAIRKFSALPAQRMHLTDRGVLKKGLWADIVIFDPATIRDKATFDNPNQLSEGIEFALVNGVARRASCGRLSRWNPVAITVIFTVSFSDSFSTTPKLICASSLAVAPRISEQASFTSCRLSLLEPVMLISTPRAPFTPPSSISGELMAWRAASMDAFSPDADAVPIIA